MTLAEQFLKLFDGNKRAHGVFNPEEQRGMQTQTKTWVEPMTLKSFVKEQVEKGENLPYDLLGIYVGQRAKIRR